MLANTRRAPYHLAMEAMRCFGNEFGAIVFFSIARRLVRTFCLLACFAPGWIATASANFACFALLCHAASSAYFVLLLLLETAATLGQPLPLPPPSKALACLLRATVENAFCVLCRPSCATPSPATS